MMRALSPWVLALIVIAACSRAQTGVQPRTFDRAGAITFTCFDREERVAVPLDEQCTTIDADVRFAMVALVTQTSRGEVASVDLASGRVLDTNDAVPGFTFQRVLPVPIGITLRPDRPTFTYVASFGARRVQAVPTERFLPGATPSDAVPHEVELPGPPTDLVISPDGSALFVSVPETWLHVPPGDAAVPLDATFDAGVEPDADAAMAPEAGLDADVDTDAGLDGSMPDDGGPDADGGPDDGGPNGDGGTAGTESGAVFRIPLDAEGTMGTPERLGFRAPEAPPDLRDLPSLPPSADVSAYQHACIPAGALDPDPPSSDLAPPPLDTNVDVAGAHPVAMEVDALGNVLLVADDRLPLIHRFDISTAAPEPMAPLVVGVATRDLALTPPVPARPGEDTPGARYLFALDDNDESVLVVDYTAGSPSEGAVLPVSTGGPRPDRLLLPTGVRAIEVITPSYEATATEAIATLCTPGSDLADAAAPLQLRGVFLVAGSSDGSLRTVDVHDLDLPCRGYPDCEGVPEGQSVFVRRHSPRIQQVPAIPFVLTAAPLFRFAGTSTRVAEDGTVETGDAPGLAPFDACPDGMRQGFPELGLPPLACLPEDAWMHRAQRWLATWEGPIPGASGRGFLRDDGWFDAPGGTLCGRGVLGSDDAPVDPDPDAIPYGGDALVITSTLDEGAPGECRVFEGQAPAFRIRSVRQTRLELGPALGDYTLEQVRRCFAGTLSYAVRTSDAYTVAGSLSGFQHRRMATADGTCATDDNRDPRLRGRAFDGEPFRNTQVAFQLRPVDGTASALPPGTQLELQVDVGGAFSPQVAQLGERAGTTVPVLPSTIRFNPLNGRVYVVDAASRGLLEVDPQPLRLTRPFE
jgi:hypothetical protein